MNKKVKLNSKKPTENGEKKEPPSRARSNEFKDLPFISEQDWQARELRHMQRIQDVKVCLSFITESIEDYNKLQYEQSKALAWKRYIDCDGLPRVSDPPDIRKMIAELNYFEELETKSTVNWELAVDERCVLSQSIFRQDLTRQTLQETLRPNIGKFFEEAVSRILITLERIECMLNNEHDLCNLSTERIIEVLCVRPELSREIDVFFDKLTYRIVSAPSAFRTSYDGIKETYSYNCPNFNYQVWWLSDVPVRFEYMELPLIVADLDSVGIQVQIPLSVLCDNLTLRCVHTLFDHLSEEAKSYEQVIDGVVNINGGIMDIDDCLVNEWLMQLNLVDKIISALEQRLTEYEQYTAEVAQKEAAARLVEKRANKSRSPKDAKSKRSEQRLSKRILREPEMIPEGMFPDPLQRFIEQEQQEFDDFLNQFLNPQNLKLAPDEINLRQYNILGGLYSMHFVRKPMHKEFEKFNITLHEDGRILYTQQDVRADVGSRRSTRLKSRFNYTQAMESPENRHLKLAPDEVSYFCVTFRLPKMLCLFGEPVVCQFFEEEIDDNESDEASIGAGEVYKHKKKHKKRSTSKTGQEIGKSKKRTSGGLDERIPRPNMTLIKRKSMNVINIYRPSVISVLRNNVTRFTKNIGGELHDFEVDGKQGKPLTPLQVHELVRCCIPRVLSSFKFPMEFRLERTEEVAERAGRGCTLLRRHHAEAKVVEVDKQPEFFSYDKQTGPERLFPIFDQERPSISLETPAEDSDIDLLKSKHVKVRRTSQTQDATDPTKLTLFGIMHTLDEIEKKYKTRTNAIMDQSFGTKGLRLAQSDMRTKSYSNRMSVMNSKPMSSLKISRSSHSGHLSIDLRSGSETDSVTSNDSETPKKSIKESLRPKKELPKVKHWTTRYIKHTEFLPESCTLKIQTDRLGVFGFAFKSYEHFPFKGWSLQYNKDNINEIIFTLDTYHVRVVLFITNAGIRGYATKIIEEYVANPIKYLEIKEPTSDFTELRRRFCENNINIFAAHDACYYIEKGYFSQKHLATELHVYDAFAIHCKLIKFYRCDWNRLAPRRNILLCLRNPKDVNDGADVTIRVTPDNSTFVEVSEACTDDVDVIKLSYHLTWRNIGVYSDVHHLINSMYPQATDVRNRDPKLIHYIRTLFKEIRPLSFS
ncbi:uncharacterized protein LOC6586582 isoform X1 [Drosophila mojavensis]|uniref:uncharacterized protein LOC6586582 isoform X1 n=1 Tax=Drosophila mojavensis TaxID=7230 RepID=UPI001CD15E27|nr:uncharacterized protein LOC6586582 isoform X1 [Drosophila mojavensis]